MSRGWVAAIGAAVMVTSSSPAGAEVASSVARADALFNEAKALRDGGRYAEACAKFDESNRLSPGVGVALYVGDCYDHVGKTASAWVAFRAAEKRARERNDDRAAVAGARAKALEPKLSRITLVVARSLRRPGVEVWLDGAGPVAPANYALGVAADRGDHIVALKFAGRVVRTITARVSSDGQAISVALDEPPLPPPPPEQPARLAPAPERSEIHVNTRLAVGIGLLAVGAAGMAVGAGFLVSKNESMSNGGPGKSPSFDQGDAAASTAGFVVGAAAIVSAIVLYLTAPKRQESAAEITVAPMPLAGGGGASMRVSF